ncbi:MAG: helix-turn-helix transcriptional regulator [Clostridiales Family XIII bacterium]|nr:helix-turn-helix transcriptional regulator [Clostridiales Family XIII bacterium]
MKQNDDFEIELGGAIRKARIRKGYPLEDVAARANLSPNAVRAIELGRGSSLATLIKVLRVLDELYILEDWIDAKQTFSPIEALRQSQGKSETPQRVSRKAQVKRESKASAEDHKHGI